MGYADSEYNIVSEMETRLWRLKMQTSHIIVSAKFQVGVSLRLNQHFDKGAA